MKMPRSVMLSALALLGLSAAVGQAVAAPTARASATLTIYAGPGQLYAPIGRLPRNSVVSLSECTPRATWCRIVHDGPDGWVLGSYLVGSAAKVEATPWRPLVDPFRFGLLPGHRRSP